MPLIYPNCAAPIYQRYGIFCTVVVASVQCVSRAVMCVTPITTLRLVFSSCLRNRLISDLLFQPHCLPLCHQRCSPFFLSFLLHSSLQGIFSLILKPLMDVVVFSSPFHPCDIYLIRSFFFSVCVYDRLRSPSLFPFTIALNDEMQCFPECLSFVKLLCVWGTGREGKSRLGQVIASQPTTNNNIPPLS